MCNLSNPRLGSQTSKVETNYDVLPKVEPHYAKMLGTTKSRPVSVSSDDDDVSNETVSFIFSVADL